MVFVVLELQEVGEQLASMDGVVAPGGGIDHHSEPQPNGQAQDIPQQL
jgi:hypothetical protein